MKHLGPAAAALAFATAAAAQPAPPRDGAESDGFAIRARRFLEEMRTRDCDARPDGPARRACVDSRPRAPPCRPMTHHGRRA